MSLYGDPDSGVPAGDKRALETVERMATESANVWFYNYPTGRRQAEEELRRRARSSGTHDLLPPSYWQKVLDKFLELKHENS